MLQLAQVGPKDFVLDLGSGDGRIVILAAKRFGARGLGVEIVPELVRAQPPQCRARRRGRTREVPRAGPVQDRPVGGHGDHDVPAAGGQPAAAPRPVGAEARHTHRLARLGPGRLEVGPRDHRGRARQDGRPGQAQPFASVGGAGSGGRPVVRHRATARRAAASGATLPGLRRHASPWAATRRNWPAASTERVCGRPAISKPRSTARACTSTSLAPCRRRFRAPTSSAAPLEGAASALRPRR